MRSALSRLIGLLLLLPVARVTVVLSQDKATTQGSPAETIPHLNDQDNDANPARKAMETRAAQQRSIERQKKALADAAQLALLSNELKVSLDKAAANTLPSDSIQKAADIEKIAKRLKDELRTP
jgi:hypothetical protein